MMSMSNELIILNLCHLFFADPIHESKLWVIDPSNKLDWWKYRAWRPDIPWTRHGHKNWLGLAKLLGTSRGPTNRWKSPRWKRQLRWLSLWDKRSAAGGQRFVAKCLAVQDNTAAEVMPSTVEEMDSFEEGLGASTGILMFRIVASTRPWS